MRELLRTNDAVLVSAIAALADQNISVLEGSIGAFPRRLLVAEEDVAAARRLLVAAGLGHELLPDAG